MSQGLPQRPGAPTHGWGYSLKGTMACPHICWMPSHMSMFVMSCYQGPSFTWTGAFPYIGLSISSHNNEGAPSHWPECFFSDAPSRRYEWGPYLMLSRSPMGVETHHMNPSITSHRSWIFPIGMRVFPQISGCVFKEDMVLPHRGLGVPLIWVKSTVVRTILAISKASSSHSLLLS